MSCPESRNNAISAGNIMENLSDQFAIPILVDEHLCVQYYNNKEIRCANNQRGVKRGAMDDTFITNLE